MQSRHLTEISDISHGTWSSSHYLMMGCLEFIGHQALTVRLTEIKPQNFVTQPRLRKIAGFGKPTFPQDISADS